MCNVEVLLEVNASVGRMSGSSDGQKEQRMDSESIENELLEQWTSIPSQPKPTNSSQESLPLRDPAVCR
jgi:hypothetical protein